MIINAANNNHNSLCGFAGDAHFNFSILDIDSLVIKKKFLNFTLTLLANETKPVTISKLIINQAHV